MINITKLLCLLVLLLAAPGSITANDPASPPVETYLLRYQFQAGEFVHYEVDSETSMTLVAKDVRQTTRESRHTRKHYRIVSVAEDGTAVLEPVIDAVVIEAQSDDREPVRFDSKTDETPAKIFRSVKDRIGVPLLRVRYQPTGAAVEVLPVSGLDKRISTDPSLHGFLTVFPDQPIAVGENWNDDFTVKVDVRLSENRTIKKDIAIRRRYTLSKVADGIAHVTFRTYPVEIVREPDLQAQLIQRSLSGEVQFDIAAGTVRELKSSGAGVVHGLMGPASSMQTSARNVERRVNPEDTETKTARRDVQTAVATGSKESIP